MINLEYNCRFCLCSRCKVYENCGLQNGDTADYCESRCFGEGKAKKECEDFESSMGSKWRSKK